MAESLVSDVVSQLAKLLIEEAAFLHGVKDQVGWIKGELERMESFLEDAESRKRREGTQREETWIRQIRDVAYQVENIIDTVKFMAERQRQRRGFMGSISRYSHKPCELITLHKIGSEIDQIKSKIDEISLGTARYGTANLSKSGDERKKSDREDSLQALREIPDHFFDDTHVIGFENDKKKLVKLLVDPENKNRRVISIVGMGGLGKTTLASKVYNMDEVKRHFDTYIWLTISQKYDVQAILKDIMRENISSITEKKLEKMKERELKEKLHDFFKDRKYFIVMDDVWEVLVWERILQIFPDTNNGSRVLLTSRNIEVARSIDPSMDPHELQLLDDAESWKLFCKNALPNQDVPEELLDVGRNLAKKCCGLPLALVVLGRFMSTKNRDYAAWSEVDKSIEWEFMGKKITCLDVLALSYDDLPHQLKSCFLYIAAFPEDSIISASKLVRLWTAEGFIPQRRKQMLEETARSCVNELVQRCMIEGVEKSKAYGRVKSIRIHDLLREVGISKARKDGFLHVCSGSDGRATSSGGITCHRAAFQDRSINEEVAISLPGLRTLLGFNVVLNDPSVARRFLNGLNLLRVLDLEDTGDLEELPKEIGNMIHLRYLGLRRTGLQRLPSSIGHLLNLQTLDVRGTEIIWLPKSFWKIRTLRHVYIHHFSFIRAPMVGDHQNLQTLKICSDATSQDGMNAIYFIIFWGVKVIKNWTTKPVFSSKEMLKIYERTYREVAGKSLNKINSLVSFSLEWMFLEYFPGDIIFGWARNLYKLRSLNLEGRLLLPDSNQFPPNLTKLILSSSCSEQDPMPVLERLPNLRFLNLRCAYNGNTMSCSHIGGFPRLQHLVLECLYNLEEWRVEVGAMPSLTHLTINECYKLKMLPEGLHHVTSLRELKLIHMLRDFHERVRNEFPHIPSIIFNPFSLKIEEKIRSIAFARGL